MSNGYWDVGEIQTALPHVRTDWEGLVGSDSDEMALAIDTIRLCITQGIGEVVGIPDEPAASRAIAATADITLHFVQELLDQQDRELSEDEVMLVFEAVAYLIGGGRFSSSGIDWTA